MIVTSEAVRNPAHLRPRGAAPTRLRPLASAFEGTGAPAYGPRLMTDRSAPARCNAPIDISTARQGPSSGGPPV